VSPFDNDGEKSASISGSLSPFAFLSLIVAIDSTHHGVFLLSLPQE
jgi:hypothetical protein